MNKAEQIYENWEHVLTVAIRNGDLDFTQARELNFDMVFSGYRWTGEN